MPFKSSARGAYGPQGQKVLKGPLAPVWSTSGTLPGSPVNQNASFSFQLVATDDSGDAPTYTLNSGALPTGLSLSSSGLISGTATQAGTYNFTINATDVNGRATTSNTLTIAVQQAGVNVTFTVPTGIQPSADALNDSNLISGESFTTASAASISMNRSNGFRYFTLPAGTYAVTVAGAEGSGTFHGYGIIRSGTMTLTGPTQIHAVVGHNGTGNYAGGGMSGIAIGNSYTSSTPIFVAGAGGGGYSEARSDQDGMSGTSGGSSGGSAVYDAGAGWFNDANASYTGSEPRARSIRNGGIGGKITPCGDATSSTGGFGGGGGSCPAGGGGYNGGGAGGNSPAVGGGGGGSYHDPSYISGVFTVGYRGQGRSTNYSSTQTNSSGYITIQKL